MNGPDTVASSWDKDKDSLYSVKVAKKKGVKRREYNRIVERLADVRDTHIRQLIDGLSGDERRLVIEILRDIRDSGDAKFSTAYQQIWEMDYKERPAPIEQFIDDPYYLGDSLKELYPGWRKILCEEVFPSGSRVNEVHLGGSIGHGKSFVSAVMIDYILHKLLCLKNPQRYYGLAVTSRIVIGVYSVTKMQVTDVTGTNVRAFVEASPWFAEKAPWNTRLLSRLVFPNSRIQVILGSQLIHALGKDVFSMVMSEANFMEMPSAKRKEMEGAVGQAEEIYMATKRRIASRFIQVGGSNPGMVILDSSEAGEDSFTARREKASKKEIEDGEVKIFRHSEWELKDPRKYVKPKFYVELGDRIFPSRLLDAKTMEEAHKESREGAEVIEVPGEHYSAFNEDLDKSIRDIAGRPTHGLTPLIRDRFRIHECITDEWQHPFTRDEIMISDMDSTQIDEYFQPEKMFRTVSSRYQPRIDPHMPRFVHVDIGLRADAMGIVCGHVHGMRPVKRIRPDGTTYDDKAPVIYYDFMLRVVPPVRGSIDISKMRTFLVSLKDMGLPISLVSFDGYQSFDSAQILRKSGFLTQIVSVDKTDEAYLALKQGVYDNRLRYYKHTHFIKELENLERDLDAGKVDHPDKFPDGTRGSKDVADAAAAVHHHCTADPSAWQALLTGASDTLQAPGTVTGDTMSGVRNKKVDWAAVQELRAKLAPVEKLLKEKF